MSLDITWMSQGYRHFRLTGYNPVGLKYPAQDIRIYNEINKDSKNLKLIVLLIPINNDIELLQKKKKKKARTCSVTRVRNEVPFVA